MTDYQKNPDSAPRGRHTRGDSPQPAQQSQSARRQGSTQPATGGARQQGSPRPRHVQQEAQQQPVSQQSQPQQQRRAQQQSAQPQTQQPAGQQGQPQSHQQQSRQQRAAQQQPQAQQRVSSQQAAPRAAQQQVGAQTQRYAPQQRQPMPSGYRPASAKGVVPVNREYAGGNNNGGRGGSGSGKKKGGPWKIVFWVAMVVLIVALVALGAIAYSYWKGQSAYDAVAEEVFSPPSDIEGASLADITVDWDKLKATNPDTVAWVYIPGTRVNYPVVHTDNDDKYLTTDFNGEQTWGATYGTIFLAAANAANFSDANNIVYGHHLNNGSMFADIADFENPDTFNSHRVVYILTPQGNFKLRTFSLVHCAADDPLAQTAFADEAERSAYMQDKADRSVVPVTDAPAMTSVDHGFAFATCDSLPTDGRFVLFAYIEDSTVAGVNPVGATPGADVVDPNASEAIQGSVAEQAAA